MRTASIDLDDFRGVFAVPPLARRDDARRSIAFDENERLVRHLAGGGLTRLLYGGNAFLYHIGLADYEALLDWLSGLPDDLWAIPSAGPSFGRVMDQAALLRRHGFPAVMMLPCSDPRDAAGLERGYREIAEATGTPLILYLKRETDFGLDREAGLDAVARLVEGGVCVGIKYAVVREDPTDDPYLDGLLERVDRRRVVSGIGERPAVVHMQQHRLAGFTTGSGCVQPQLCSAIHRHGLAGAFDEAEALRRRFLPLEDLRDAWGPSKVLHHAVALAGLAETGPVLPLLSPLSEARRAELAPVAQALAEAHHAHA